MLDMRAPHRLRVFVIVCYHYGDGGVVFPYACDEVLQFVIAQEGLCGDGDKRTYIVLCLNTHMRTKSDGLVYQHGFTLTFLRSRIVKFRNGFMSNFDGKMCLVSFGFKLDCGEDTNRLDEEAFHISGTED